MEVWTRHDGSFDYFSSSEGDEKRSASRCMCQDLPMEVGYQGRGQGGL